MHKFWQVAQGHIQWRGNWEGIAPGWKGHANHGYEVPLRDLRTPEGRERWLDQIEEKSWPSDAAKAEFSRIVAQHASASRARSAPS